MFHVRTVKTASDATAIQVVRYLERKRIVVKHIGSAHTPEELFSLKKIAMEWVEQKTRQQRLFPPKKKEVSILIPKDKLRNLGFRYMFAYESITRLFNLFKFTALKNRLLLDLVLIRIIQPASKVESLALLFELFGIKHSRSDFYRSLKKITALKETVEKMAIDFAKKQFVFDFTIVFYDVTTLYYESFKEDEDTFDSEGNVTEKGLKKDGFSKDFRFNQPQIVIGLMVTREGFPVAYEIFEGNTFEGDTFIPMVTEFKKRHAVEVLTVVADAAMISFDNIQKLKDHRLSYIVGARIANLKHSQKETINRELIGQTLTSELEKKDGISTRLETDRGLLICDFSFRRYQKDLKEMEKQIIRAETLIKNHTGGKRIKFLKLKKSRKKEKIYEVNTDLIEQTKLLLGIKGYYTNLLPQDSKLTNKDIIDQYHNLWQVEKAFRIAKNDLQMRPIYHFGKLAIKAHALICFMALAVCTYMELKSRKSTKKIIKLLKAITDARLFNTLTSEEFIIRSEISPEIRHLLEILSLSH
jgi:transposase